MNKLAKEYNAGLEAAQEKAREHNQEVIREFAEVGIVKGKHLKESLLPIPQPCPENLDKRWVRSLFAAFSWRKMARNTAGQYLVSWQNAGFVV